MPTTLEVTIGPPPGLADRVTAGLVGFNREASGSPPSEPLTILALESGSGEVRGGLRGKFTHGWLHVAELWLDEGCRGEHLGAEIMARAEAEALARGLIGCHLDSFDFQAPEFYRRLGYAVFGVVEDHPPGHRRYFLQKRFANATAEGRSPLPSPPETPDLPEPPAAGGLEADARVTREAPGRIVARRD